MKTPSIVVMGTSLGGLHALQQVFQLLPEDFSLPIAVVQHRHKSSNERLPQVLQQWTKLKVVDAEDKQMIKGGHIYLAPADYHLLVEGRTFSLSADEPVKYSRPSVDVLFESAAESCGDSVIAVVMTGANEDGAAGARRIAENGGMVFVQDPSTAESPVMPAAVVREVKGAKIVKVEEIAEHLEKIAKLAKITRSLRSRRSRR
jgi:two-component system, chemotaxis family, protein-glutamate methylesterase/glutaminase